MFITKSSLEEIQDLKSWWWSGLEDTFAGTRLVPTTVTWKLWPQHSGFSTPKTISGEKLGGSLRILLDIYSMGRGTQYRNKTFRNPWSGHRITYSSSSTCRGLGILYPSRSKLTIFLPSIRGYGEPPKKEKVTSCYNTLLQGMSSPKICCCRCCFYSKWKEITVSGCEDNLFTHPPLYLPHLGTMGTKSCRQCKSWCKYLLW